MGEDRVEYYFQRGLVCAMESSIVPTPESHINIRKVTWRVLNVTYTLDDVDDARFSKTVAVVHLGKM